MSVLNSQRRAGNSLGRGREVDVGRVDDRRALGLEGRDRVGQDRLDDGRGGRAVRAGAPDADPGAVEGLVVEELRVVREGVAGLAGGRRVVRVDAGRGAEQDRSVGHVAGHRAGRVLVGADRDDAGAAPQARASA